VFSQFKTLRRNLYRNPYFALLGPSNISAFNPVTGRFLGNMMNPNGTTLAIDGLWALRFGNDGNAGPATTLFFTAGPNDELNGLLGTLTPIASEKAEADEQ
jgi:hypothetical protein